MKKISREHFAGRLQSNVREQQHEKMEKLESQLQDFETKARKYRDAVNASRVESAKGWVGPR
jgi:hypothetical protein